MNHYLFKISTKRESIWSRVTPRPVYLVTRSKEAAEVWALENLVGGLVAAKITRLGVQVGNSVFSSVMAKKPEGGA